MQPLCWPSLSVNVYSISPLVFKIFQPKNIFSQVFSHRIPENLSPIWSEIILVHLKRKILSNYENYVINADRVANELERYESVEAIEKFLTDVASGGKVDMIKNFGFDLCSPYYPRAWLIARICSAACLLILLICVISLFRRCLCGNGASKRNTEKSKLS